MQVIWILIAFFALGSAFIAHTAAVEDSHSDDLESPVENDGLSVTISWEFDQDSDNGQLFNSTEDEQNAETEAFPNEESFVHEERRGDEDEQEAADPKRSSPIGKKSEEKNDTVGNNTTCGAPPPVENADVEGAQGSASDVGAVVSYRCDFGFVADEYDRSVQCLLSEENNVPQWTHPKIRCFPRSCGDPGSLDNGYRTGSLFTFPNSVSYHCDEGYKLKGNGVRYCQTNGKWSGRLPTCHKIFCSPPPDIGDGTVSYTSLEYGSELHYQCDQGFCLKKYETRTCTGSGIWSGVDPVCQDSHCDPLEAPKHGKVIIVGGKATVESRAIYTCDEGRILKGAKVVICLEEGKWTSPAPKCLEPCIVPNVPHGRIGKYEKKFRSKVFQELSVGSQIKDGEELHLFCESNYEPLGKVSIEEKLSCEKGEWSDTPRCEPERCRGNPPYVGSAGILKLERHHGGHVEFKCYKHFKKIPGNLTCVFGSWKGKKPICIDTRCKIDNISFPGVLKPKKVVYHDKESFIPMCDNNHTTTKSDNLLTCDSGTWTGQLPPCTPASCLTEPPKIEHGGFQPHSQLHSSVVTYECEEPFLLVEPSSKIRCLFGRWEGTPPTCEESRCYVKDLEKIEGIMTEETVVGSERFLRVKCAKGFTATGSEPFCSKGVWSLPSAPCRESDCTVYQIQNGDLTMKVETRKWNYWRARYDTNTFYEKVGIGEKKSPASTLYGRCQMHFSFQGKGTNHVPVTCKNGKWKPRPICLSNGASYTEESTTKKQSSIPSTPLSTSTTAQIVYPTEASVLENKTNVTGIACTCTYLNMDDQLLGYSGSEFLQPGMKVKDGCKVTFFCKHFGYYRLQGPNELLCKNCADWHSSEYPHCTQPFRGDTIYDFHGKGRILPWGAFGIDQGESYVISCFANGVAMFPTWTGPAASNTFFHQETEQYPNVVSYKTTLNIMEANENNNGVYQCRVQGYRANTFEINVIGSTISCPEFPANEDLSVQYNNGQRINSRVTFTCRDFNKEMTGPAFLTCTSSGNWSGEPPKCKSPVTCLKLEEREDLTITYSQGFNVGSLAAFHCVPPRVHVGAESAMCRYNGKWSNPLPSCLLPNCSMDQLFEMVPEGVVPIMDNINSGIFPYNSTLNLTCESNNLALQGPEIAKCGSQGKWEVASVQCVPGCSPPKASDKTLMAEPEKNFYRVGAIVSLSCPLGYNLSTDVFRIMCLGPQWSETEELPHCITEE